MSTPEESGGKETPTDSTESVGVIHLSIAAWSFLPTAVMMSVYSSMRSIGETRVPLRCSIISIFTNVFLNYCLIFGAFGFPRLELRGAAAATVFISIPLGAGNKDEARENAYRLLRFSMALAVVLGIFIWLSRSLVPILYSGVSAGAQKVAADVLGVQACLFWIYMGGAQCYFTLRAGGDMRHTLIMDSGFMWAFAIPAVAFTTYCTNLPYLWPYVIGELTEIVKLIFAFRLVKREEWLVNLTETEDEQ